MSMTEGPVDTPARPGAAGVAAVRERAGKFAGNFDRRQRTIAVVVFAATIGAVLAFSFLRSRTDWAPLMTDLTADDASAVTKQLDSNGTPYQLADGGSTIEVPSDVVYQTRIDIASVDMPSSGKVGYGILDNQDLTSSEFSQRIGFQRAMEGELGKTIESIDGVTAATVHLAIPKNDTFALDEQKATASVMVRTAGKKTLTGRQVQAIVNLVSGGIEGLSPSDVTVADGEGNVLAAPGTAPGGSNGDSNEMQKSFESSMSSSIEAMLATIVGPGKASATVTADLDFDATTQQSETYSPPTTIVAGQALAVNESTKTETYNGSGGGQDASGILGTTGTANPTTTAPSGSGGYQLTEKQVNNAVNKVVETTNKAPGAVKRLSVAVVVDEDAVDAGQLSELEELVTAAAGIDKARGDSIKVSRFKLDKSVQKRMSDELAFREKTNKADSGVPVWMVGAGGAVALVVIAAPLLGRRRRKQAAGDLPPLELGRGSADLTERVITIDAHPRRTPDHAGSHVLAGVGALADGSGAEPAAAMPDPAASASAERREALGDLIDNQPDEVAQLLRSWLGDRREASR